MQGLGCSFDCMVLPEVYSYRISNASNNNAVGERMLNVVERATRAASRGLPSVPSA